MFGTPESRASGDVYGSKHRSSQCLLMSRVSKGTIFFEGGSIVGWECWVVPNFFGLGNAVTHQTEERIATSFNYLKDILSGKNKLFHTCIIYTQLNMYIYKYKPTKYTKAWLFFDWKCFKDAFPTWKLVRSARQCFFHYCKCAKLTLGFQTPCEDVYRPPKHI